MSGSGDYISREAAIAAVDNYSHVYFPRNKRKLEEIPAADVRPVVRGRWEKCVGENGVTSACRCSLCGFEDNRFSMFNYCPNCGADMRPEPPKGE